MWAVLGEIEFQTVDSPTGMDHHFVADYVQHALITKKPRLEAMGSQLDTLTLDINLHHSFCNVEERIRLFREAILAQVPLALVMGNGDYKGPWVIVDGTVTVNKTSDEGQLVSSILKLSLLEYTGEFEKPLSTPGISKTFDLPTSIKIPDLKLSLSQQALSLVQKAQGVLGDLKDMANQAMTMTNPLENMSTLLNVANQGLGIAESIKNVGTSFGVTGNLVAMGAGLIEDLKQVKNHLSSISSLNIDKKMLEVANRVNSGLQRINDEKESTLQMIKGVITRRAQ